MKNERLIWRNVFGDKWMARFNEIQHGQRIAIRDRVYIVEQKNEEPAWLHVEAVTQPREELMIYRGDPRLFDILSVQ